MNRLLELQQKLADDAARSDIECHCLHMAGEHGINWSKLQEQRNAETDRELLELAI
jgi:hypothetical protein